MKKSKKGKKSETFMNKVFGITAIGLGVISIFVGDGDATAFILFAMVGIPLLFAKTNWIDL